MRGKIQKYFIGLGEELKNINMADIYFSLDESNPFVSPIKIGCYSIHRLLWSLSAHLFPRCSKLHFLEAID